MDWFMMWAWLLEDDQIKAIYLLGPVRLNEMAFFCTIFDSIDGSGSLPPRGAAILALADR
jgi:hypothetical protein